QRLEAFRSEREEHLAAALDRTDSVSNRLEYLVDALRPDPSNSETEADTSTFARLQEQLEELGKRLPDKAEIGIVLERLDLTLTSLVTQNDAAAQQSQEAAALLQRVFERETDGRVLARLDQLQGLIETRPEPPDFDKVSNQLASQILGLRDEVKNHFADEGAAHRALQTLVATKFDGLMTQVTKVVDHPATSEHLANLGTQIESLRDTVLSLPKTEVSGLEEMVTQIVDRVSVGPERDVDLGPVQTQLEAILSHTEDLPQMVSALREEIAAHSAQTLPQLDLTAQRQSFARFATAMNTVLRRLEDTVDALGTVQSSGSADREQLIALVQALPLAMEQVREKDPLYDAVTELREGMIPLRRGVEALDGVPEAIGALARRPDPIPDMTEQRRSFARFGTALSTVVNRLEEAIVGLAAKKGHDTELKDLSNCIELIARQLADLSGGQKDQMVQLAALEEMTTRSISTGIGREGPECFSIPKGHISLEEIRYLFAETIANQIKRNAESVMDYDLNSN
ncbi:MAG: hypothetical protein P1U53_00605, partial [Sulfitobacter sp.]|nr:hypothetical protein [Sulfitobacter sp.]